MEDPVVRRAHVPCPLALIALVASAALAGEAGQPRTIEFQFTMGDRAVGKTLYQLAAWVETPAGEFLGTVYVTAMTGKEGLGNGRPKLLGLVQSRSPEALPVWAFARGVRYGKSFYPPRSQPLPDAITGPTPKAREFTKAFELTPEMAAKLKGTQAVCVAEVNVRSDGAPSMVFRGTLDLAKPGDVLLRFIGTGHPKGISGRISQGLDPRYNPSGYIARAAIRVGGKP